MRRNPCLLGCACSALALALITVGPAEAQETPPDAPSEAADPPDARSPDPDAGQDAPQPGGDAFQPMVGFDLAGGLGFVDDELPGHRTETGMGRLGVFFVGVPGLRAGVEEELQRYARRYASSSAQPGSADVPVDETRSRTGLVVGLDILELLGEGDVFSIEPRLRGTIDVFANEVFPLTAVAVGGDLALSARPVERFRLFGDWSYQGVATATDVEVAERLHAGAPIAEMRWRAGAVVELPPRVELALAYEGEWIAYERASRFTHGLTLGLTLFL